MVKLYWSPLLKMPALFVISNHFRYDTTILPGDYGRDGTPDPIPNSEVKSSIVDGTSS